MRWPNMGGPDRLTRVVVEVSVYVGGDSLVVVQLRPFDWRFTWCRCRLPGFWKWWHVGPFYLEVML